MTLNVDKIGEMMINQGFEGGQLKRNKRKKNEGKESDLHEKLQDGFDLLSEEDPKDPKSNLLSYKENEDE